MGAVVAETLMTTRRMLRKSNDRKDKFVHELLKICANAQAGKKAPAPGPASAFIGALIDANIKLDIDEDNKMLILRSELTPLWTCCIPPQKW